jgi:6,7-dimethyl-8-ribityllumazine synthase
MSTALKQESSLTISNGQLNNMRFGIVVSEWNSGITNMLLVGAIDTLLKNGVKKNNIVVKYVPGSFELTCGAQLLAEQKKSDAIICLGCVIQGETKHFDFICDAVANGITNIGIQYKLPVIFGVLTTNNLKQAKDRSGGKYGNKGEESALTAMQMAILKRSFR